MKTYGIRYDNRNYKCGDVLPVSHNWIDNVMQDETLAGTCAIYVDYDEVYDDEPDWDEIAKKNDNYPYNHAYVITSTEICDWGDDPCEIVMPNATVYKQLW